MTAVLTVDGVSKAYPDWASEPRTIRSLLSRRSALFRPRTADRRWALRDVSFEVLGGRSLGLIGHNGAGKSTLLRLASGLGRPTEGSLTSHPDVASVINLGATFDSQLTGLENAYTAQLIAGIDRRQARRQLDDVIDFAGLREFATAPVRTYSEGMKLRLAFGVISVRHPRLLILDEVLAVGDLAFRRRCEQWIASMQARGTSLLLASHSLEEVTQACQDALWLEHGRIRARGEAAEVAEAYANAMRDETLAQTPVGSRPDTGDLVLGESRFGSQEARIAEVRLQGTADREISVLPGASLRVGVGVEADGAGVADPIVGVTIRRASDALAIVDINTHNDGVSLGPAVTRAEVELTFEQLDLPPGDYTLDVGVYERGWQHAYDYHFQAYRLHVEGQAVSDGVLDPPRSWRSG